MVIGVDRTDSRRIWLRTSCCRLERRPPATARPSWCRSPTSPSNTWHASDSRYRATHDALTGLPNRLAVLNHIAESLRAEGELASGRSVVHRRRQPQGHQRLARARLRRRVAPARRPVPAERRCGPQDVVGTVSAVTSSSSWSGVTSARPSWRRFIGKLERSLSEPMALGTVTVRTQAQHRRDERWQRDDQRSAMEILRDADAAMYETKSMRRRRMYRKWRLRIADGRPTVARARHGGDGSVNGRVVGRRTPPDGHARW